VIVGADRQVLGHAFDGPEWPRRQAAVAARHVELKRVRDLVSEDPVGFDQRGCERENDAAPRGLGDTADAVAEQAGNNVGLRKFRVTAVQDERLGPPERVPQHARQAAVPSLGEAGGQARGGFLARVVVDGEMLGIEDLEVEVHVLDFVSSELLRPDVAAAWPGQKCQQRHNAQQRKAYDSSHRFTPRLPGGWFS
jgi:hypothetical protein